MAQGKGGAVGTVLMIGSFIVIGAIFYWLSITAVPAPAPAAVEEAGVEAIAPVPDMMAPEAPATN